LDCVCILDYLVGHYAIGKSRAQVVKTVNAEENPSLCSDRDLNLDTSLNVDDDLLHNLSGSIEIDQPLVNAHLIHIPCLRTLTARSLSGRDLCKLVSTAIRI
jgi:hypothetical protein